MQRMMSFFSAKMARYFSTKPMNDGINLDIPKDMFRARAVAQHVGIKELIPTVVNEFVNQIIVPAPDRSSGWRRQKVEIIWNFVGKFDMTDEELTTKPETKQGSIAWCYAALQEKLPYQYLAHSTDITYNTRFRIIMQSFGIRI